MELLSISIYLIIQLFICFWISRYIKNEKDYFVAGKKLNLPLASFSIFATWFGAETCIGSSAAIFNSGLSGARADPFGYTVCLILAGFLLAAYLWRSDYITVADFYRNRFSKHTEKIAILIQATTSLMWAAAQIRALGQIISITTPFDVNTAIAFATLFVISYTFLGGLLGDVISDLIQGIILITGLSIMLYYVFDYFGGIQPALNKITPEQLSFVSPKESLLSRLDIWLIPILGSIVTQEFASRVLACKSAKIARNASLVAAFMYLSIGLIPVIIGLLGSHFNLALEHNDEFLPSLAKLLLPDFVFIIFAGALVAAILSTVDSTLLSISALISHNILSKALKINLSDKKKIFLARTIVIISGVVAFIMAISADSIFELAQSSSSFGMGGLFVITIFGLWSKLGNGFAATMALITGIIVSSLSKFFELEAPFIYSIIFSALAYIISSFSYRSRLNF